MESIYEFDKRIKNEISHKANDIKSSERILSKVISGIEEKQSKTILKIRFRKYAVAILCSLIVIAGITFMASGDARAMAMGVIKTVFILDKDNKVIEKPANEIFLTYSGGYTTNLNDEEFLKKMGIKISFPQTICGDFNLTDKSDWVGILDPVNYEIYDSVTKDIAKAINNEDVFKSLDKYHPYRSIGAHYKSSVGANANIYVCNKVVTLKNLNYSKITETIETKVNGINAKWIGVLGLDYPGNDYTQKPLGEFTGHVLFWTTDTASYCVSSDLDQTLNMEDAIKYADAFMQAQK